MKNVLLTRNAFLSAIIGSDTSLNDVARAVVGFVLFALCGAVYLAVGIPILLGTLYGLGYSAYHVSGWLGACAEVGHSDCSVDQPFFVLIAIVFGMPIIGLLMSVAQSWLLCRRFVQVFRDRIAATRFWCWLSDAKVESATT